VGILATYVLFGFLVFGDPVPMSVHRKALAVPALFTPEWAGGALHVAQAYVLSFLGKSPSRLRSISFLILNIALVLGVIHAVRNREKAFVPVGLFSLFYALGYIASGSKFIQWWPWYFAPPLTAA
jgi:hypothetical protein